MGVAAVQHFFSGHETFPFRYPWLKKGYDAALDDGDAYWSGNSGSRFAHCLSTPAD